MLHVHSAAISSPSRRRSGSEIVPPKLEKRYLDALKTEDRWEKGAVIDVNNLPAVLVYGALKSDGTIVRNTGTFSGGDTLTDLVYVSAANTEGVVPGAAPQISIVIGTTSGLTEGTQYEILQVMATDAASANVGNRILKTSILAAGGNTKVWASDGVTLTASQTGAVYVPSTGGGYHFLNDNGTLANSAAPNSPLPVIIYTGDAITLDVTDPLENDVEGLAVWARRVA